MTNPTTKKKTRMRKATPKPPRKVRVAIHPPPIHDVEAWFTFGNKLVAAAAAYPALFVSPPYIPALTSALTVLGAAITAVQGGTDAAQTALLTATIKVKDDIDSHAGWVQTGANALAPADATNFITSAGFQVALAAQRVPITAPVLKNGPPTVVLFAFPPSPEAVMWFTELSLDGGKTYGRSTDTERLKGEITGLTSGMLVYVRVRAFLRGSGYTPWTVLWITVT
jgi:hypothetical protein